MNKIIIKEDIIDVIDVDESINVEFQSKTEFFTVNKIKINILGIISRRIIQY